MEFIRKREEDRRSAVEKRRMLLEKENQGRFHIIVVFGFSLILVRSATLFFIRMLKYIKFLAQQCISCAVPPCEK